MQFMQQAGGTQDQSHEHVQRQHGVSTDDHAQGSMQQQGQTGASQQQQSGTVQFTDWASI